MQRHSSIAETRLYFREGEGSYDYSLLLWVSARSEIRLKARFGWRISRTLTEAREARNL